MKNETQLLMSYEWKPPHRRPRTSVLSDISVTVAAVILSTLNLILK